MSQECLSRDKINFAEPESIKRLVINTRQTIGALQAVINLLEHFIIIIQSIEEYGNTLGTACLIRLDLEFTQLKEVFNYDTDKIKKIIEKRDMKQYLTFIKSIKFNKSHVINFNDKLKKTTKDLNILYMQSVQQEITPKNVKFFNSKFIRMFGTFNCNITRYRIFDPKLKFIVEPKQRSPTSKHRSFLTAAGPLDLGQEELEELNEGNTQYPLHKPTRYHKCMATKDAMIALLNKASRSSKPGDIYPIINPSVVGEKDGTTVSLGLKCLCEKTNGKTCGHKIELDKLIDNHNLGELIDFNLLALKKRVMYNTYGIEVFLVCPSPDCPNGNGFVLNNLLEKISNGQDADSSSDICKCDICNAVWCSKCYKIHPGRICADTNDGNGLEPNIKRCPCCNIATERIDGCFHINCTSCNTHWCWNCNYSTPQSNAYAHNCITGNWVTNVPQTSSP
jgi:hypothetical protein